MKNSDINRRLEEENIKLLLDYINKIKYGSVTVNIQDGKIVQIEKNEKIRIKN
ncbi:YezD family protein [Ruminiclostridium herbifermentans]|uniref:YezD family protein n=1 Tax=Ruminiclostridium herbifermentans TaxID=2488810 RepID=A0A4U7JIZ8_9FIRM|nr:YezD family protein [Ruminiclostridium herbifermentans]QNU68589.1 YezD family protein [Ruminiclostridium herbifermentans]